MLLYIFHYFIENLDIPSSKHILETVEKASPFNIVKEKLISWTNSAIALLPNIAISIIIFLLFFFLGKWIAKFYINFHKKLLKKKTDSGYHLGSSEQRTPYVIGGIYRVGITLLGLILAIESLQLGSLLSKLLTGAGVIGIILGVSLQGIASSLFSGLLMSLERPFQVGDDVTIDGTEGTVEDIGFLTTKIISIKGQRVFIPNQIIFTRSFSNLSSLGKRRVIIQIGVSYDDDLENVRRVTLDELSKCDFIEKEPEPQVFFINIGPYTYDYSIRFWIKLDPPRVSYLSAQSEVIIALKKRYMQEKINLAYPIQTIEFSEKNALRLKNITSPPTT